jgi:hypothetical protein
MDDIERLIPAVNVLHAARDEMGQRQRNGTAFYR